MCNDLENDAFGTEYKIIQNQLKLVSPTTKITTAEKLNIASSLFIMKNSREINYIYLYCDSKNFSEIPPAEEIPLFSEDELDKMIIRIKTNTAPGPDGLSPKLLKHAISENKSIFINAINNILTCGVFPISWRSSKLIMVPKPKIANDDQTKYRPTYMLDRCPGQSF